MLVTPRGQRVEQRPTVFRSDSRAYIILSLSLALFLSNSITISHNSTPLWDVFRIFLLMTGVRLFLSSNGSLRWGCLVIPGTTIEKNWWISGWRPHRRSTFSINKIMTKSMTWHDKRGWLKAARLRHLQDNADVNYASYLTVPFS